MSLATGGGGAEQQASGGEAAMEEEQLQALLRDLDALRQRPDDPASIDRVTPLSRRAAPWISAVCLGISPLFRAFPVIDPCSSYC